MSTLKPIENLNVEIDVHIYWPNEQLHGYSDFFYTLKWLGPEVNDGTDRLNLSHYVGGNMAKKN